MHDDRAMIRGRNARKRALHRSGVSISLSRLSDRTIGRTLKLDQGYRMHIARNFLVNVFTFRRFTP